MLKSNIKELIMNGLVLTAKKTYNATANYSGQFDNNLTKH